MDGEGGFDPETKKVTEEAVRIAHYVVVCDRLIDKVPVVGSGEKIRVYISSNGNIIGHSKVWRQLASTPSATRPVVPVAGGATRAGSQYLVEVLARELTGAAASLSGRKR